MEYGFDRRATTWLVDLDALPRLPRGFGWLCRFRTADHQLGDGPPARSLRAEVDRFLAERGVHRPSKVLMLANPRLLGLRVQPADRLLLLRPARRAAARGGRGTQHLRRPAQLPAALDEQGRAGTDKQFYVSPFYPVDGRYAMLLPEPGAELTVAVTLYREADRPFSAVLTGRRRGDRPASLWAALRTPLASRAVMWGIRRHGIALYLKGLTPLSRPSHGTEEAVATEPHHRPREAP